MDFLIAQQSQKPSGDTAQVSDILAHPGFMRDQHVSEPLSRPGQ